MRRKKQAYIKEYRSCSRCRCLNVTPLELWNLLAWNPCSGKMKKYQDQHTLLVPLLARLSLVLFGAREGLVYGSHGDGRVLFLQQLTGWMRACKKVRELMPPRVLA